MSFQSWHMKAPIRIMMINPLIDASKLAVIKLLSQHHFGKDQLIDVILLVYTNELPAAKEFAQEIIACSFGSLNTIVASTDLPSITDADIFYCITNFPNPNMLNFENLDTEDHFDTFYLYIKVALSLGKSISNLKKEENESGEKKSNRKPIVLGDGLVVLDIINSFVDDATAATYISCFGLPGLARSTLAEYLKVRCTDINKVYVWGANLEHFHVEIEKPYIKHDKISDSAHCDWEMVSKDVLNALQQDSTQFNASWMRKEFIIKLKEITAKNQHGPLFRSWNINRYLMRIAHSIKTGHDIYRSCGFISDGSLRTIKGLPYFLPVIMRGSDMTWEINQRFGHMTHLIQEIQKYNVIVQENHEKLMKYCHKFLQDNIINQSYIHSDTETVSTSWSSSGRTTLD